MQATLCKEPFEFILIENTYTEDELRFIFLELDFLCLSNHFQDPQQTGSARTVDGKLKKSNKGIFLHDFYTQPYCSNIFKFTNKIFDITLGKPSTVLNTLKKSNDISTLISYYEDGQYYQQHDDVSGLTSLTYLYKNPKAFSGGELILNEYGYAFEPWFNRTYIIPGRVVHEVTPVVMKPEDCGKGLGRYCISTFINLIPPRHEQVPNQV